jgi:nucleoside-diphosphate-sugar epimerase
VYVDNVVHAIRLASVADGADGQAFILADEETVTWADLYGPVALALGFDIRAVPNASGVEPLPSWLDRLHELRMRPKVKAKLTWLPLRLRRTLETALSALPAPATSPWTHPEAVPPVRSTHTASREMALLYGCRFKLPHAKASAVLGYRPLVTFEEGCRRTIEWLAFAGFPVRSSYLKRAASAANG